MISKRKNVEISVQMDQTSVKRGGLNEGVPSSLKSLSLDLDDLVGQLRFRLDHFRVRLEVLLRRDQCDQFLRDIHVGGFERTRLDRAEAI